ncbi:MAG: damage-inducible protein DinB [Gemmatimonadaceae bacterium]|nr:damage-inducible protein DinB [Gemmatimonadaceae bacterium]
MTAEPAYDALLDALLDSWDRNNTILVNLVRALPAGSLDLCVTADSMSIHTMLIHMHYCRLVFVEEDVPECAVPMRKAEWKLVREPDAIIALLDESARVLREAVRSRIASGRPMDRHYDHPLLMLQHFIWHEGYHHGQVKLALKAAGMAFDDEAIGQVTWDVWMDKGPA